MVLQVSGPISLADIQAEFGGTTPTSIDEYYRGGAFVPDTAANAGIPTSGLIRLTDFYGGDATTAIEVDITVNPGRRAGVVGLNRIDIGYWDGNPSDFTTATWNDFGSVSSTNINGLTLSAIGFSNENGGGPPVNDTSQRNFWVEFVGNVTGTPPTRIDVETNGPVTTSYFFNSGLINWSYNATTNRTRWRHTFNVSPRWSTADANSGNVYDVKFVF